MSACEAGRYRNFFPGDMDIPYRQVVERNVVDYVLDVYLNETPEIEVWA
jgi:hypothetical protein